jgi:sugar phosphate isomerase/epimerase
LGINLTPTEAGQFDFNGLFATLYRVGESVWLVWLLFIVAHRNKSVDGTK